MLAEFSPLEHWQTKVNRGGIKSIDMTVKLKDSFDSTLARLGYHEGCIFLEDAIVTLLVSLAKIASCYGLADSQMIEFSGVSLQ